MKKRRLLRYLVYGIVVVAIVNLISIIIGFASFGFLVIKLSLQTHDVKESQIPIQKDSIKKIKIDISMETYDKVDPFVKTRFFKLSLNDQLSVKEPWNTAA